MHRQRLFVWVPLVAVALFAIIMLGPAVAPYRCLREMAFSTESIPPNLPLMAKFVIEVQDPAFLTRTVSDVIVSPFKPLHEWSFGGTPLQLQLTRNKCHGGPLQGKPLSKLFLWLLAEATIAKERVLGAYLAFAPFGKKDGMLLIGAQEGSEAYFKKSAEALTASEALFLATDAGRPSLSASEKKQLRKQRDFVLRGLYQNGQLTRAEYSDALAAELPLEAPNQPMEPTR